VPKHQQEEESSTLQNIYEGVIFQEKPGKGLKTQRTERIDNKNVSLNTRGNPVELGVQP